MKRRQHSWRGFYFELDTSNRNRLQLFCQWLDERELGLGISWGNGNSDPVWLIDAPRITLPAWLARRLP